jgi:formate hydrogenlyase subunit 3/multisubunit Na+/H+ antiporter MnhD subunit
MYSPFKPASQRVKWYMFFSFIFPLFFVSAILLSSNTKNSCIDQFYNPNDELTATTKIQNQGNLVMAMILSIYIVVAIYSVVYSYRRLMRPGVSKEVRQMFFRKHFYYVCIFIFLWTIQQSQNYFTLFNPND